VLTDIFLGNVTLEIDYYYYYYYYYYYFRPVQFIIHLSSYHTNKGKAVPVHAMNVQAHNGESDVQVAVHRDKFL